MRVLLVSTYEMGHQPLHVASPAAALRSAGHQVRCLDLSVEHWDERAVDWADAVAFSVPMHTAMRLAQAAADAVRRRRPGLAVHFFGLYAGTEDEDDLLARIEDRAQRRRVPERPARDLLPPIDRYARLAVGGEERLVGYVEASRGCSHRCRHCPVPIVYDGRTRPVEQRLVLEDVAQLVDAGARHITFGDPDFLNRPLHSMRVVRALHERFSDLTFDCTVKVAHVLRHADLWGELANAGCLFVVSAVECLDDRALELLDKGHTATDASRAVGVLRAHGIEMRPSFLPFTPWATVGDVADIVDFVLDHDLVANVDPVQYTIRLLLPEGSLLLGHAGPLGPYDAERLSYTWASEDPAVDALQARLARLVEDGAAAGEPTGATFLKVRAEVLAAAGRVNRADRVPVPIGSGEGRPRLTEPWFC